MELNPATRSNPHGAERCIHDYHVQIPTQCQIFETRPKGKQEKRETANMLITPEFPCHAKLSKLADKLISPKWSTVVFLHRCVRDLSKYHAPDRRPGPTTKNKGHDRLYYWKHNTIGLTDPAKLAACNSQENAQMTTMSSESWPSVRKISQISLQGRMYQIIILSCSMGTSLKTHLC